MKSDVSERLLLEKARECKELREENKYLRKLKTKLTLCLNDLLRASQTYSKNQIDASARLVHAVLIEIKYLENHKDDIK
jgi:hypothetical protein